MAYSSAKPKPLFDGHSHQLSRTSQADNRPPASHNVSLFAAKRREKPGRGGARPYVKTSGESDRYGIDIAPLKIFENQGDQLELITCLSRSVPIWQTSVFGNKLYSKIEGRES